VTIIHLIHFNIMAQYQLDSPHHPTATGEQAISGRSAFFDRYLPAAERAVEASNIDPPVTHFFSTNVTNLLPHNDIAWDVAAVRQFCSFAAYTTYQTSREYVEYAVPHREAALADWSLVACIGEGFPGGKV
jgi:hypothetical protein